MTESFILYNIGSFYNAHCIFLFHNNQQRDLLTNKMTGRHIHVPLIMGGGGLLVAYRYRLITCRGASTRVNPLDPVHSSVYHW